MLPQIYTASQLAENAYYIVLAPLIAAAFIILLPFFHKTKGGKSIASVLSISAVLYGFCHSVLLLQGFLLNPKLANAIAPFDFPFFEAGVVKFSVGYLVDNLTVMMLLVVTSVSLLVQVYTHGYMREDPGYSKFYAYLSLFTFSMLGLVVATNLFQMYFFWELVGVCSYFLIGFWFYKESAARAALKAFVVNRVGDALFLMGLLLLFGATSEYWAGHNILSFSNAQGYDIVSILPKALAQHKLVYDLSFSPNNLALISVLIFVGPMAKSAQFPLHVWLPDAMEGPTPISALIHAATMVAAGVYLVARAYPIWQIIPEGQAVNYGLQFVGFIGTFTAFMAATIAMTQFDIKRGLAWSTVSQLGYMFAGLGAGAFTGGLFHLFNHAFFKAMLFLGSGAVIHGLHGEQDMRHMGGLRKHMPGTAITFAIGCLSISGIFPLSGFFSKDEIIGTCWNYNNVMGGVLLLTAFMTAFYMWRIYFMTFEGEYRGTAHPHNSPPAMVYPLIALAIPSVASGWLGWPGLSKAGEWFGGAEGLTNAFAAFVFYKHPHFEAVNVPIMMAGSACGILGIIAAYMVYVKKWNINTTIASTMTGVYNFSLNKWYFDEAYYWLVDKVIWLYKVAWNIVDKLIVDSIVDGSAFVTDSAGQLLKYTENGRAQTYALAIFSFVAMLTLAAYFFHP